MVPMATPQLHHVSIDVDDVDAARRFYVDLLGLQARRDRPDFAFAGEWLDAGGSQVHLVERSGASSRGPHFAMAVDDLDAVIEQLRGQGLSVDGPVGVGNRRQAFLEDPSGNLVELQGR